MNLKLTARNLYRGFLPFTLTLVLLLNLAAVYYVFSGPGTLPLLGPPLPRGIRLTDNGTVKISFTGLLLPADQPNFDFRPLPIINEHKFTLVNKPRDACLNTSAEVLVAVVSAPVNFDRRRQARRAQERVASTTILYLFFIGTSTHLPGMQQRLDSEAKQRGDIVQGDFEDTERNLTLKSIFILKFIHDHCSTIKYFIKKDDDVRLRMAHALDSIQTKEKDYRHFILGSSKYLIEAPIRDELSKYYTSREEYADQFFPMFVHGPAYGCPGRTALLLYQMTQRVKLFWLEDVYITGICARRAHVPVFFDSAFKYSHDSEDSV